MDKNMLLETDLAEERRRAVLPHPELCFSEDNVQNIHITRLAVTGADGASVIGKPIGSYFTMSFPTPLWDITGELSSYAAVAAELLTSLLPTKTDGPLLIVGLGNHAVSADAFGPKTARMILADAHMHANGTAVIIPGTEAESGISVQTAIKGYVNTLKPRAVIVFDALCAGDVKRLLSVFQFCDTGITPGSGIGKGAAALNAEALGCPVIAVGVPTVIASQTEADTDKIRFDHSLRENSQKAPSQRQNKIYLCPKDTELGIAIGAEILSRAIDLIGKKF